MSKKENNEFSNEMTLTDILLRLKALETLLISKGIFTQEDFSNEMSALAAQIAKTILQKANIPGDLDKIIKDLQDTNKKIEEN
jgi:hypothetical protein